MISVCIPTCGRADLLAEALESVVGQGPQNPDDPEDLEVVVSDNGSTDHTGDVVRACAERHPYVRYLRLPENLGFKANLRHVVEGARGRYCWFLGDDDALFPGAVARVRALLDAHPDLGGISLNYALHDRALNRVGDSFWTRMGQPTVILNGFEMALPLLGNYLGFFSGHVVHRETWLRARAEGEWDRFLHYIHAYMTGATMRRSTRWCFLADECLKYRGGAEDPLRSHVGGAYQRVRAEVEEYDQVLRALAAGDDSLYRRATHAGVRHHLRGLVATNLLHGMGLGGRMDLAALLVRHYRDDAYFWSRIAPLLLLPRFALRAAKGARRVLRRDPTLRDASG